MVADLDRQLAGRVLELGGRDFRVRLQTRADDDIIVAGLDDIGGNQLAGLHNHARQILFQQRRETLRRGRRGLAQGLGGGLLCHVVWLRAWRGRLLRWMVDV